MGRFTFSNLFGSSSYEFNPPGWKIVTTPYTYGTFPAVPTTSERIEINASPTEPQSEDWSNLLFDHRGTACVIEWKHSDTARFWWFVRPEGDAYKASGIAPTLKDAIAAAKQIADAMDVNT